jgi:hypothetical protein
MVDVLALMRGLERKKHINFVVFITIVAQLALKPAGLLSYKLYALLQVLMAEN